MKKPSQSSKGLTSYLHLVLEMARFGLSGLAATVASIGLFWLFTRFTSLDYRLADAVSVFFGILTAYIFNKFYVFKAKRETRKALLQEIFLFWGLRILTMLTDVGLIWLAVGHFHFLRFPSKIGVTLVTIAMNYVLMKFFVFSDDEKEHLNSETL